VCLASRLTGVLATIFFLLTGCSSLASRSLAGDSEGMPIDSLRVIQVLAVDDAEVLTDANRFQTFIHKAFGGEVALLWDAKYESNLLQQELNAAMISEGVIRNGSIVVGRAYCCSGPQGFLTRKYAYASPDQRIVAGDYVEVRFVRSRLDEVNTISRIVHSCEWVPRDIRLGGRIPYCSWMKAEGWHEESSVVTSENHAWIKPFKH